MNDERFERELRAAARGIADGPAPKSLRARVVAIPVEHPRPDRGARPFGVVGRLTTITAGLVLLVIAGTFISVTRPHDGDIVPIRTGGPSTDAPGSQPSTLPTPAGPTPAGGASNALS
ncbi:MAG: hypothetical protein ACRDGQ_06260, partial [Candidatus Limnocylindrales bacterium]